MLTITVFELNGIFILEAIGRLDSDTAPELGQALDDLMRADHYQLVLDLGGVEYISSAGLREIVRVFKCAQAQGGDLCIANPSERVHSVLQMAGLDTTLHIFRTRAAAVASF